MSNSSRVHTVLVVDDDPISRRAIALQIEHLGHRALQAGSGRQALQIIAQEAVDAVLLDVIMPDVSGLHVLQRIKAEQHTENLPVLIMTGLADQEMRLTALASGAEELLSKPVDRLELGARLRNMLKFKVLLDKVAGKASQSLPREAAATESERADAAAWRALTRCLKPMAASEVAPPVVRCGLDGRLRDSLPDATYLSDLAQDLFGRERIVAAVRLAAYGQAQRVDVALRGLGPSELRIEPSFVAAGAGERVADLVALLLPKR